MSQRPAYRPQTDPQAQAQAQAIAEEQEALDAAYRRRDELIAELTRELDRPAHEPIKAARARTLRAQQSDLIAAEEGLVFGRIDALDGTTRRLGRIGIRPSDDSAEPLVTDWRAPVARPFYTATPIDPQGQSRRRHVRTHGRQVIDIDDEPLDHRGSADLVGEGALLSALAERRTGRMGTAVATLQREQDDIVRADARGALVVQGGPGTGKTIVALHRVAYLLFTYPQLAAQGVLVIGPSRRFLDYISHVLPALGETAVVATTCDELIPGSRPDREERREVAEIKGRALWQETLERYVVSLLPQPVELRLTWEGEEYRIPAQQVSRIIAAATSGRGYHPAREYAAERLVDWLAEAVADGRAELLAQAEEGFEDLLARVDASLTRADDRAAQSGAQGSDVDGVMTDDEIEQLRTSIAQDHSLKARIQRWWPSRDAATELRRLWSEADPLARWAPSLTAAERQLVLEGDSGWSSSDIPLLDSLADLLGGSAEAQGEFLAERAAGQRDWIFGHVIVDEAQELSAMQWQMILRRCPTRSITAVGDIDQTEAPHRHTSWSDAVGSVLGDRWRQGQLTICYRTPREVMHLTGLVLERSGSRNQPPRALRASGISPWRRGVAEDEVVQAACVALAQLRGRWRGGTVGVVVPTHRLALLRESLPGAPVVSAAQAKGLEWDATLIVDPDGIAAEPRGWNGLYVAITRCTQELGQLVVQT